MDGKYLLCLIGWMDGKYLLDVGNAQPNACCNIEQEFDDVGGQIANIHLVQAMLSLMQYPILTKDVV